MAQAQPSVSSSSVLRRGPFPPQIVQRYVHKAKVYHPGYPSTNLLMEFDCHDITDTPSGGEVMANKSVAAHVVHLACAIVADNAFAGFLSTEADFAAADESRIDLSCQLKPGEYFFHVPIPGAEAQPVEGSYKYPVLSEFSAWRFPRDFPYSNVMQPWMNVVADTVDELPCVISGVQIGTEGAHILPQTCSEWFCENELQSEIRNVSMRPIPSINVTRNKLSLRADLHKIFDDKLFAFVPHMHQGAFHFYVHCFTDLLEVVNQCHNVQIQWHPLKSRAMMLSRFAWTLFPLNQFFSGRVRRLVILPTKIQTDGVPGDRTVANIDVETLCRAANETSRSASKKKRRIGPDGDAQIAASKRAHVDSDLDSELTSSDSELHNPEEPGSEQDILLEEYRGRSRWR